MMSNRAMLGLICIFAAAMYYTFGRPTTSPPAVPAPEPVAMPTPTPTPRLPLTVKMRDSRVLHNVKVTRCDPDGFVVSSTEGVFKLFNQYITPEVYAQLKQAAPPATSTPTPWVNPMDQTPKPSHKGKGA